MKKIKQLGMAIILLLCTVFCQGQDTVSRVISTDSGFIAFDSSLSLNNLLYTVCGDDTLYFGGYRFVSGDSTVNNTYLYDTVKSILLITDCNNCQSRSIIGYVVKIFWSESVKDYLNIKKKKFPYTTIIWDWRLK